MTMMMEAIMVPHSIETAPNCQICYCDDGEPLFADLCQCRGSVRWIHAECLRDWLQRRRQAMADDDWQLMSSLFNRQPSCSICKTPYSERVSVKYVWKPIHKWRLERSIFTVLLYIAVFILLTTFICTTGKLSPVHICALGLYFTSALIWWLSFSAVNQDVSVSVS